MSIQGNENQPKANSYEKSNVKAQPKDPEKVRSDSERRLRELEKNRQQNPSFQNPNS